EYVNVHALSGTDMIKREREALQTSCQGTKEPKLLAVTILTSFDDQMLQRDLTLEGTVEDQVIHFAQLAYGNGADGVVCSVHESEKIKRVTSQSFETVTLAIRLSDK